VGTPRPAGLQQLPKIWIRGWKSHADLNKLTDESNK